MTWSYRVLRTSDEAGEAVYRIHEVYYGDDGSIDGWTVEPVQPLGESLSELREDIRYFLAAFRKPVLEGGGGGRAGGPPALGRRPGDQRGPLLRVDGPGLRRPRPLLPVRREPSGDPPARDATGVLREGRGGSLPRLPGGGTAGARERRGLSAAVRTAGGSTVGVGSRISLPQLAVYGNFMP